MSTDQAPAQPGPQTTVSDPLLMSRMRQEILNPYGDYENISYLLHTVRVMVVCKSGDRGEIYDIRPIYEYPLLKKMYQLIGGTAKISPEWYPWKDGSDPKLNRRRLWRMTKEDYRMQISSMRKKYTIRLPSGERRNIFDEVYGTGGTLDFAPRVQESHKRWVTKVIACRRANKIRLGIDDITDIEWEFIAEPLFPADEKIADIPEIEVPELTDVERDEVGGLIKNIDDPTLAFFYKEGVDADIAIAMVELMERNECTEENLRKHGKVSGKTAMTISTALTSLAKFKKG